MDAHRRGKEDNEVEIRTGWKGGKKRGLDLPGCGPLCYTIVKQRAVNHLKYAPFSGEGL